MSSTDNHSEPNGKDRFGLTVTYLDGHREHFEFPPQMERMKMAGLIEKLLTSNTLSLQLPDRLMVIPTTCIRSAELSPAPEKLPEMVLRDVQRHSANARA
jgi:hypothetical protein